MRISPTPAKRDGLLIGGVHAALALYFWAGRGVTIVHDFGPDPWSWFWQNISADLLRDHAVQSLWWLHAQPPLWNAFGAVLIKAFPASHMQVLQACNIALGTAVVMLVHDLVTRHTHGRWWGIAAGLAVALHPSMFLFEAYALYAIQVAFLILLAARLLSGASEEHGNPWRWVVGFFGVVSALILTRSLYHLVLLAAALPLALFVWGRPTRRTLVTLGVIVLLPTAWYGKNAVQFGFFGGSSWYGMGLWRSALFQQDIDPLNQALAEGRLDPVVRVAPFSQPSGYASLGYTQTSDILLLDRDDLHNVNIPEISAAYQRSARSVILSTPSRYAANVVLGYGNFSAPSSSFPHLTPNRERMGRAGELDRWILLRPVFEAIEQRSEGGLYYGSLFYFLFPAILLVYAFQLARRLRDAGTMKERLGREAALVFLWVITLYTAVVGCTMELGENVRFKFPVEPAFLVLTFVVVSRLAARRPPPATR